MQPNDDLSLAVEAAQLAATVAVSFRRDALRVSEKGGAAGDVVTQADVAAERAVLELLASRRPGDGVLGEEGSERAGVRRWLVDAIDGTLNFVRGDPFWCSAVALEDTSGSLVSAVHHASTGETFSAVREEGCWLDGRHLTLGSGRGLDQSVLAIDSVRRPR